MDRPPKKSKKQTLVEVAGQGALGSVPWVGSALASLFVVAAGHVFNQRQQQWFEDLADAVAELQARADLPELEELVEDPVFLDAVIRATRAAQETHSAEKLSALRNGILNSVGPDAPSVDEQTRFIRLVDEFGPAHLLLLQLFSDARATVARAGIDSKFDENSWMELIVKLPGMQDEEWIRLLTKDLADASLSRVAPESLHGFTHIQVRDGRFTPSATGLGLRFLQFIADPV